jgi:hypothetical protein
MAFSDPKTSLALLGLGAFLVAFCAPSQDVVIDGWRIDAAGSDFQGILAATSNLGYRLGLITAGAGALFIASAGGWTLAYLIMAALMLRSIAEIAREEGEVGLRIGEGHQHEAQGDGGLRGHHPGPAATQPRAQDRDVQAVDRRSPEELQRVGQRHVAEQADGAHVDIRESKPEREGPQHQQQRQARRETEREHQDDAPVLHDVAEPEAAQSLWLVAHGMELLSLHGLDPAKSWQLCAAVMLAGL